MENIVLEGTGRTPYVSFDAQAGKLELSGRSIPENSITFYKPLFDWVDNYVQSPKDNTTVIFNLEYFNTSSSKCILDLLRKLETLKDTNNATEIKWYFDEGDEDMEESGNDFKSLINLDIELVMK
ncbi:MAG TPA: nuclear pore complex subunit [Microscillaceae bacterium]|nr:nuclear pore complex subunit [Microscillaceae bacterium]